MEIGAAIFFFFYVLIPVVTVGLFIFLGYNWLRNRTSPVVRVTARVARKRHFSKDISVDLGGTNPMLQTAMLGSNRRDAWKAITHEARQPRSSEIMLMQGCECFITFIFNGKEEELKVPSDLYVNTPEGAEGLLVYQGEIFKHFITGITDQATI